MNTHVIATVLAVASLGASPVQHWYTEDTKYRICTTLEQAYDFLGSPRTPAEFLAAFAKEGSHFDILRNDAEGIILQQRDTKVPIPIFRKQVDCDSALNRALQNHGEKYGSPFIPWVPYSR
ncbi:MAG TPA: hypothetical protein VFW28_01245 [Micropepsaceae bacterium]|nr:hypothetical protein [Micropepsaceae bacterium]